MVKVLIVDDNTLNLDILRDGLKDRFSLSMAKNGKAALKVMEKHQPDLLLLDVLMPVMDGYETYKNIVGNPNYKNLPVIFLSGVETLDENVLSLDPNRFVRLVTKPFDLAIVIQTIEEALKKGERNE